MITRRNWMAQIGAAAVGLRAQGSRRPNILYIMLDDAGTADFGCYGQKKIQTPTVDKLATEGMRFTARHMPAGRSAPLRDRA